MLEEHKSPAGGGIPINAAAAIDYYRKAQNWSANEVYDQM